MRLPIQIAAALVFMLLANLAAADPYQQAVDVFKDNPQVQKFFNNSYGYALFPTIGKGAVGVGGAHGKGRVYRAGQQVGDTRMTQLSVGVQLGGQAYSQIIFFENKQSFDRFTSGNFEFGANASAVAITAGASAQVATTGLGAGASGTSDDAGAQAARYNKGVAVFTHAKGGLMYEASLAGQKFSYTPL